MPRSGHSSSIDELMKGAARLPPGLTRLAIYEEAVRFADTHGGLEAGFKLRKTLIDEAAICKRYDVYAAAFSWCLSTARANRDKFSTAELISEYQFVIGKVVNFPDVTREQYDSLFDDMIRERSERGLSLRTAYLEHRTVAQDFGDRGMAVAADIELRKHPRVEARRSEHFETVRQIEYDSFIGDDLAAIRAAEAYLGKPSRTLTYDDWIGCAILIPLLRVGRFPDAARWYELADTGGYSAAGYVWGRSFKLEYAARIGDVAEGLREFRLQLPLALAQADPLSRYYCLRPSVSLFDALAKRGVQYVTMKAPENAPWKDKSGRYEAAVVRDWLHSEASEIAEKFDRRNGNTYFSDWLAGSLV